MALSDNPRTNVANGLLALPTPTFIPRRYRPGSLANWSGHLAFANDLIAQTRPSLLVELGTHYGESYFGMCQSVFDNGLSCICYAIDHWLGEEHAGNYGEEVFTEVNGYNNRCYKDFSYLLRATFDEALGQFSDESIDLLHIDGFHTYEAVSHDIDSWFPKVRPGGIILLHDIAVRHGNFGIWKLWEELRSQFNDCFTFHHSWGLGVLRKPSKEIERTPFLDLLFSSAEEAKEQIRRHYVLYSSHLERLLEENSNATLSPPTYSSNAELQSQTEGTYCQVFLPRQGGYSESASFRDEIHINEQTNLCFDLPSGTSGCIRLDPANRPCILEIGPIKLVDGETGESIWAAETLPALQSLESKDLFFFSSGEESCYIICCGSDPALFLPVLQHNGNVRLEASLRLEPDFHLLLNKLVWHGKERRTLVFARADAPEPRPTSIKVQVFPFRSSGYTEADAVTAVAEVGRWNTLTFDLKPGSSRSPIRFDPADTPCIVELAYLQVIGMHTDEVILDLRGPDLRHLVTKDSAISLSTPERYLLFCFGTDPQVEFSLNSDLAGSIQIRVSARFELELDAVAAELDRLKRNLIESSSHNNKLHADLETIRTELRLSQASRVLLAADLSQLATGKISVIRDKEEELRTLKNKWTVDLAQKDERINALQVELENCSAVSLEKDNRLRSLELEIATDHAVLKGVETSLSWRMTKPMRHLMGIIRRLRRGTSPGTAS